MVDFILKAYPELGIDELYEILSLRQQVFVVEQNCTYLDADHKDQAALHVLGLNPSGELTAYARLLPVGLSYPEHCSIGRVITSISMRGLGLGNELMMVAISCCKQHFPGIPIKISAQTYLIEFYKRFGFQAIGGQYLEDGLPHIAMVKNL